MNIPQFSSDSSSRLVVIWNTKNSYTTYFQKKPVLNERINKLTILHITNFINNFYNEEAQKPAALMQRNLMIFKKWENLSNLCHIMPNFPFSQLKECEINNFLLGNGICTGIIVHYFNQFFQMHVPLEASPFPLALDAIVTPTMGVNFYPFKINKKILEEQTTYLRFLQATYKLTCALKPRNSLEFLPNNILKNNGIEIVQRIPDNQVSGKNSFNITDLTFQLKQVADQDQNERGYLLGIGGSSNHALALYLKHPFHFVDPSLGIGTANNLEDLILFLASYLTKKYPNYLSFALLAFAPQPSCVHSLSEDLREKQSLA